MELTLVHDVDALASVLCAGCGCRLKQRRPHFGKVPSHLWGELTERQDIRGVGNRADGFEWRT
jgi:hypothetical protein